MASKSAEPATEGLQMSKAVDEAFAFQVIVRSKVVTAAWIKSVLEAAGIDVDAVAPQGVIHLRDPDLGKTKAELNPSDPLGR